MGKNGNNIYGTFGGAYAGTPVVVTGHTGFKGSWLALWLAALGARVTGFSTDRPLTPRNSSLCRLADRIDCHVRGDVRDFSALQRCFAEAKSAVVFHLAAQSLVLDSYDAPKETMDVNAGGTVNVLEAARLSDSVRAVVAVTTDKVYEEADPSGGSRSFSETDTLAGREPYSASKAMAELAVRSYRLSWDEKGFAARPCALATARSGNAIGGGDFAPRRLLPDCFRSLLGSKPFVLTSPQSVRPWQSVLEPASGYLWLGARLLEDGAAHAGAWNFGPRADDTVTCERLARRLFELWGAACEPEILPEARHQAASLLIDSRKAADRLGWKPVWSWDEALAASVQWFKEYEARGAGTGTVGADMHAVCLKQIADYTAAARKRQAPWAR